MLPGTGRVEGGKDYKDIKELLRMMSVFIAIIVFFSVGIRMCQNSSNCMC